MTDVTVSPDNNQDKTTWIPTQAGVIPAFQTGSAALSLKKLLEKKKKKKRGLMKLSRTCTVYMQKFVF